MDTIKYELNIQPRGTAPGGLARSVISIVGAVSSVSPASGARPKTPVILPVRLNVQSITVQAAAQSITLWTRR